MQLESTFETDGRVGGEGQGARLGKRCLGLSDRPLLERREKWRPRHPATTSGIVTFQVVFPQPVRNEGYFDVIYAQPTEIVVGYSSKLFPLFDEQNVRSARNLDPRLFVD